MDKSEIEIKKEPSIESNLSDEECIARNKRKRKVASDTMRKISSHTRGNLPERKVLRKDGLEIDDGREGSCDRFGCQVSNKCSLELTENCQNFIINNNIKDEGTVKNGGNYKSYHISKGEHSCINCYDEIYRFGKKGELKFREWKKKYVKESRCFPRVRMYIQDELLPYWIKCIDCKKFRKVNEKVDNNLISNFKCTNCEDDEDKIVNVAKDREFINSLSTVPLLHNSPAVFYLEAEYFYDEIGMSPVNSVNNFKSLSEKFMKPFNVPDSPTIAFCIKPDIMENDEIGEFPEYTKESLYYLAMRNLIVSLWSLNPYAYLTLEKCESYLIVRGLSRIWYLFELERVYNYLNLKCIINYGLLPIMEKNFLKIPKTKVIIIGSGISGLTVARQLRSFGVDVTILEAKNIIGGRMQDDKSLGVAVGKGAQLITGILNNPLVVTLNQLGILYKPLDDYCPLVDSVNGGVVDILADRISDEHYSCLLDAISDWKKTTKEDVSLDEIMSYVHGMLKKKCKMHWRKDFERLVQWHIGNAEFSCGSRIENVSAQHWDQNEAAPQFAGDHALLTEGCEKLMESLAEGSDIKLNEVVEEVDFSGENVVVKCKSGLNLEGSKVVLAIPLAIYQKELIKFTPKLPETKIKAYQNLGAGLIEKVAVKFPTRFWSELVNKDGKLDYFGCVPSSEKDRGLFNMFYDFSKISEEKPDENCYVLMSYVCGKSVKIVNELSDEEVGKLFVKTLQCMFPDIDIPEPLGQIVTHWGVDKYIGMSYSYIKINGTGDDYDNLAANIDRKLYFAGECTNRWFPQTMTGAFITGLREAGNILEDLLKNF
uniref:SWIRM domain-containing protein n=1 Tax=Strongyloides papillosus TaxID=174720 RepID=A0A0N5BXI1_STREA